MNEFFEKNKKLSFECGRLCKKHNLTISIAESCTGGLLASYITEIPGCSKYFTLGLITYSNNSKKNQLGVKEETLEEYGAVSEQTAKEMAENLKNITKTDIAVSITGIAGPGGCTADKPVGTIFCAICFNDKCEVFRFNLNGDRREIREQTCVKVFEKIMKLW